MPAAVLAVATARWDHTVAILALNEDLVVGLVASRDTSQGRFVGLADGQGLELSHQVGLRERVGLHASQATSVKVGVMRSDGLHHHPGVSFVVHLELGSLEAFLKEVDAGLEADEGVELLGIDRNELAVQIDEGINGTAFEVLDNEVEGLLGVFVLGLPAEAANAVPSA